MVGGIALALYGSARGTRDLDFVVDIAAQEELVAHLEGLGYETLHVSPGYSNHAHPDPDLGRVAFVHVRDETSTRIFAAANHRSGPGGRPLPVPKPEHLVAMKVQAMKNAPGRRWRELVDIRFLLTLPEVDRDQVRAIMGRQGFAREYDDIARDL